MKNLKIILLTTFIVLASEKTSFAKDKIILEDKFDSNSHNWIITQGKDYKQTFTGGKYVLENKKTTPLIVSKILPNKIDQTKDFKIEATITKISGLNNNSYDIVWGYKDNRNFYSFGVSGDGHFRYGKYVNGKYQALQPWKKWFLINDNNAKNKLEIRKTGNKIQFYINDYGAGTQPFQPFMGDYLGFVINTTMKVEIDNLLVTQDIGNNPKLADLLLFEIPKITILEPDVKRGFEVVSKDELIKVRGTVKDSSGIEEILINGNKAEVNSNGEFNTYIKLDQGENKINVIATNKVKGVSNETFTIAYKKEKDKEVIEPIISIERSGKDYGLLFATDSYNSWKNLTNPINDAQAINDELKNNYGFDSELIQNPTKLNIKTKLREYASRKYSDDDQLFIFFAGHGQFDETYKEGYIVTKDSFLKDDVKDSYISHSELSTIVNNIPCKHIFLVMDVCFGGTFDQRIAQRGDEEDATYKETTKTEFVKRKLKYKTRLYLTSGGKEYVPDGRPGQHSPFARRILEALRSYGGKDGVLTKNEMNNYVEKLLPEPKYGEFGNNEPGSDFIFVAK